MHLFLLENHNKIKKINFHNFLFEVKRKNYSTNKIIDIWEKSVFYELKSLLNEQEELSLLNEFVLSDFLEKVKQGYKKAKGFISDTAKQAWEKINSFFLRILFQGIELAKLGRKAFGRVVGILQKVADAVSGYCDDYPIICKLIVVSVVSVVAFGIMSVVSSSEAQAAIKSGSQILDDQFIDAAKGLIASKLKVQGGDPEISAKAIKLLSDLNQTKEIEDLARIKNEGANLAQSAVRVIQSLAQNDQELFGSFSDFGSKVSAEVQQIGIQKIAKVAMPKDLGGIAR